MKFLATVLMVAILGLFVACDNNNSSGSDLKGHLDVLQNVDIGNSDLNKTSDTTHPQDTKEGEPDIPGIDINQTGQLPGVACTDNKQCKYNICYDSPNITGSAFKICTKDCNGTTAESACSYDDGNGVKYTGIRWGSFHPEEKLTCMCLPVCHALSDCTRIDPRYNTCAYPGTGVYKVCMYKK